MHVLFYTHSLQSDWNHGNAHFLRGVMRELIAAGHTAEALEPVTAWSRTNLLADAGPAALARFATDYPGLISHTYDENFDHAAALSAADVVIVHEWTDPMLVRKIGDIRRRGGRFTLLFHDTHHRAVSAEPQIAGLDLTGYDGILVFGDALRERYQRQGWGRRVYVWHEAADVALFRPQPEVEKTHDLVWIGNWGDDERTAELAEFLIGPARRLKLNGHVHGVRYPDDAIARISEAGLSYGGWLANRDVPHVFARHRVTVHVPRRPYVKSLPGIPTIRMFEALACGIPLVSAPWSDSENLFRPGTDFLFASNGAEMEKALRAVLHERGLAEDLARNGRETILLRHTCRHRVGELLDLLDADYGHATRSEEAAQ